MKMIKKIIVKLLVFTIVFGFVFNVTVKAEDEKIYDEGIIYKPSRNTIEYVEKYDLNGFEDYDIQLDCKVNNLEDFLKSLCTVINYHEYSNGYVLTEYTSEKIGSYYPMLKEIIEITKGNYVFNIRYVAVDGKEVSLSYNNNELIEKFVYDESSDTAYHYYDGKYSIEYHFREPYSITMSDGLSEKINKLLEEGKYDEIEKIKGLVLYRFEDGNVAIDFDTNLIVNGNSSEKSATSPTNDTELLDNLKRNFPEYINKVKTNQQLMCTSLNSSVAVKVTETRTGYKKAKVNWLPFLINTTIEAIMDKTGFSRNKVVNILAILGIVITVSDKISEAVNLNGSAIYSYHATKRGCVYDKTVRNGYVLIVRHLDDSKCFRGQYKENGQFYWAQDYSSVLSMSDSSVLNEALTNYNNDLLMNNLLCTYYPEYAQWSD